MHLKVSTRYGFLLLILWLFQSCFPVIFYSLERYQLKHTQSSGSSETATTILHMALNQPIAWENEGEEFYYKGRLFDVLKITLCKTEKIIECIADEKETQIIKTYYKNNIPSQKNASSHNKTKNLIDLKYLNEIILVIRPSNQYNNLFINRADMTITLASKEVLTPPPERC